MAFFVQLSYSVANYSNFCFQVAFPFVEDCKALIRKDSICVFGDVCFVNSNGILKFTFALFLFTNGISFEPTIKAGGYRVGRVVVCIGGLRTGLRVYVCGMSKDRSWVWNLMGGVKANPELVEMGMKSGEADGLYLISA